MAIGPPTTAAPAPDPGPCDAACAAAFSSTLSFGAADLGMTAGACNANAGSPTGVSSPTLATDHGDVIARVQTTQGAGELTAPTAISVAYGSGDTAWLDLGPVPAGTSAQASVICRSGPATYVVSFADAPQLPATFTGSSTHDANVSLAGSRLAFAVPASGHYVADVDVSGGSIEVGLRRGDGSTPPATNFAGPGVEDLGELDAGPASLDITAVPGPQARWTVSIHAAGEPPA
jgi:hypothetical protein